MNLYLHQALQDADKHDTAIVDSRCRRDEHVQEGCEENGGSKHPVETTKTLRSTDFTIPIMFLLLSFLSFRANKKKLNVIDQIQGNMKHVSMKSIISLQEFFF